MKFKYNDGGRKRAGYRGKGRDCVVRAITIATDQHYRNVRREMDAMANEMTGGLCVSCADGTPEPVSHKYLTERGWQLVLTKGEYLKDIPKRGILIACLTRHNVAIINGTVHDSWDSTVSRRTKNGSPSLKGYYRNPL